MKRGLKILAAASVVGVVSSTLIHPIEAKGTFTTTLFRALSQYDEKYSKLALKFLTQHTFIKNTGSLSLNGKILKAGFDSSGQCLRGLELLGLSGAQIGPVSLRPTQNSEGLGALHVKANINAYLQQFHTVDKSEQEKIKARNDRIKNFKVGVSMIPDEEVMELTPYLMKENLTINLDKLLKVHEVQEQNEKKQLSETQLQEGLRKDKQYNLIDFITINRDYIVSHTDPQIENQTQQILDSFLKTCQSIAREANLAVYTISNQNYSMEFLPPADKTGVDQYNTRYSFVSWKDIVAEITS